MNTRLISLISGLAFVLLLIIALSFFPNKEKEAESPTADSQKEQNESKSKENPSKDSKVIEFEEYKNANQPESVNTPTNFSLYEQIRPGENYHYDILISAQSLTDSNDKRSWRGTTNIRSESRPSTTHITRKRLGQSSSSKKYNLLEVQAATGLAIPRRSVLVSNHLVEGAKSIRVIFEGKEIPAIVKTRLPKTGFAVLQLEGVSFPKVPIPVKDERLKEFNLAWLDSEGQLKTQSATRTSFANGKYAFQGQLPDSCSGAVAYDSFGNILGLVVDTIHPAKKVVGYSQLHPMGRISQTWGQKSRDMIFTTANDEASEKPLEDIRKRLVQVIVHREPADPNHFIFFANTDLRLEKGSVSLPIGFHTPRFTIKTESYLDFIPFKNELTRMSHDSNLPFFLGTMFEQIMLPLRHDGQQTLNTRPVQLSVNGLFDNSTNSPNAIRSDHIQIENSDDLFIYGKRIFGVSNEDYLQANGKLPGRLKLEVTQSFTIDKAESMLHKLTAEGTFLLHKVGQDERRYEVTMQINRATDAKAID